MLEASSAPAPATAPVDVEAAAPTEETAPAEGFAASITRRVAALQVPNPLPDVSSVRGLVGSLKKEAPKLLDVRSYSKPQNMEQATSRLRANLSFFRVSYSMVFVVVLLLFILSNPILFVATIALVVMWSGFMSQPPDHVLKIGSVELKKNEKLLILSSISIILVVFGGLISSALYVTFTSGLAIGTHGVLKEPVELDALEQLEQEGESIVKGDIV